MFKPLVVVALSALSVGLCLPEEDARAKDRKLIERATLDYLEAFHEAKPELIERSVHPDLDKIGFHFDPQRSAYDLKTMTRDQAMALAKDLKSMGYVPEGATYEVEVLDHLDRTAAVKIEAFWGIDYMHLIKEEDTWKIRHVIWQSAPQDSGDE